MQALFVGLYQFLKRHKALCWILFFGTFALWVILSLQVRFKEDISSMLPDSKAIKAMNNVISHTQAGEQVIFLMSFKDSTTVNPDSLISAADNFNRQALNKYDQWIDTISLQVGGGKEEAVIDIFQNNLPLFLTEQDYKRIDSLTTPEAIRNTLAQNKKVLLSPASVVLKQFVAQDPIGMSALVWKKLSALQFDPSYELYEGYLFKNNQRQLTFFLKPEYKASETGKNSKFFSDLNDFIDEWKAQHPDIHITYFGGPAVAAGNASQLRTDTIVTLSVTIILLIALTYYFFRKKRTPLLLLVPVLYGASMGMAIVYLVQGSISVIALGAGAIILGIAIDFSVHFLSHARHAKDLPSTIGELAHPLTIGSFTTIAAFLSLRLVHTPILQDLGLFAAGSLTGAALCTLIFLPHFPLGIRHHEQRETVFDKIGKWRPEKNKWLVLSIFLLTPVMLYFAQDVEFDSDLMHLNYLSPRMEEAQDEVSKANAMALSSVFVVAHGANEEEAMQHLEAANGTIQQLTNEGLVKNASNPVSLLPSKAEQRKRIERWDRYWTKEKQAQVVDNVKSIAPALGYNPEAFQAFADNINKSYTPLDSSATAVLKSFFPGGFSTDTSSFSAIAALRVPQENREAVFKNLAKVNNVTVTDRQQGALQLVKILNKDFNNIALYSSLIVFFALLIGYGRLELAIMSFLPMVVSWIWILGLMALLGLKFNIVNIIISSLIFGLGDDYAIFTMDGLIEKYKTGSNKLMSVRAAVYVSVATVIIGLGVLLLAKHPALRSIAFISVTGLVCVLFISQTLQPFLFNWFVQNRANKRFLPFTIWSFSKSVFAFAYFFTGSWMLTLVGAVLTNLPFAKEKGKLFFHKFLSAYTWSMMHIMRNVKTRVIGRENADFSKPAIYIANHSSFLDILCTTMLHPRLVLLTNKWVWKSPVFGAVVRMAEYYPVAEGAEDGLEPLRDLINRGYSIIVFPEGTRSFTDKIKRFHKGAFYISEKLKLDIVPLVLHGIHYTMQKSDWLLKDGASTVYIYPRVPYNDPVSGNNYSEKTRYFTKSMRDELDKIKTQKETPSYFREQLLRSYTYKGPSLEWYCRIKTKLEKNYEPFHQVLPRSGRFYDLGCGYGFMTYMLHWAAPGRKFIGVDYDEEKVETAQHNFLRDEDVQFAQADLTRYPLDTCDGVIISDVLHYLLPDQQKDLLDRCYEALNENGMLIIRDGISELQKRIEGTRRTEVWSTKIMKFNKTQNELHFISRAFIEAFAQERNMSIEVMDLTKYTANLTFVLRK
ncbi:MAG TPA: 1-acyl-sn-glycerol-3-phosphate acyltransferase [Flavipsychrobacter sp.]|nr:1-acyl-sn-glycerol-3-phosphate acyltransferase [Flavipsychrobacter sp.]